VTLRAIFAVTSPMPIMIAMPLSMMKSEIFDSDIPSLCGDAHPEHPERFVNPSMGGSPDVPHEARGRSARWRA